MGDGVTAHGRTFNWNQVALEALYASDGQLTAESDHDT